MITITRRKFIQLTSSGLAASALGPRAFGQAGGETSAAPLANLASVGSKFRFVILADPHIDPKTAHNVATTNSQRTLRQAVDEINAMDPLPAFVIHIGDMMNTPIPGCYNHWEECVTPLKPTQVLVHGNHDGKPPYDIFLALQKKINGMTSPFYSFDCGGWHFVAIPCNLNGQGPIQVEMERRMFEFLEHDIEQSKDKPTVILHHYHFLPVGLSQTEWYFYNLGTRKRLLELYTRHGNVKWAFNGHVHNGILVSEKTSWNYRGINFVNCPTIIEGRPYGEEYPEFETGLKEGGYYLVADVDGDKVSLQGRLAGKTEGHAYPASLQPFTDDIEPRIFHTIGELSVLPAFVNGDFSQGLSQWRLPQRYVRAQNPVFTASVVDDQKAPHGRALSIITREGGDPTWADDEYYEAYQISSLKSGMNPMVSLSYKLDQPPEAGGGYLRVELLRGAEFKFLMMFYWGVHEKLAAFYPHCVGYALNGTTQSWIYFQQIAEKHQGFYWRMPMIEGQWHTLAVNIADLYGQAMNSSDAFAQAQADKMCLAVGTWNYKNIGSRSGASFSGITVNDASVPTTPSLVDDTPLKITSDVAKIDFGLQVQEMNDSHNKKPKQEQPQAPYS